MLGTFSVGNYAQFRCMGRVGGKASSGHVRFSPFAILPELSMTPDSRIDTYSGWFCSPICVLFILSINLNLNVFFFPHPPCTCRVIGQLASWYPVLPPFLVSIKDLVLPRWVLDSPLPAHSFVATSIVTTPLLVVCRYLLDTTPTLLGWLVTSYEETTIHTL